MHISAVVGIGLPIWALGCVAPTTIQRPISPEQIVREEANQREFVVRARLEQERRLYRIAYPMLRDARSLCPSTAPKVGLKVSASSAFDRDMRAAAAAVGISDSVTVTAVAEESPAAAAGIVPGDRIVALGAQPLATGAAATKAFPEQLARTLASASGRAQLGFVHDGARRDVILVADTLCDYDVAVVPDQTLNAFADGRAVYVNTGMMYMTTDEELATVVSHEIAHNAMKHIDAKMANVTAGAIFGAIIDIFAASKGVNTGGEFTSQFAQLAAMTFSQDFEREADYVGMYILASAGWPLERAPNLWRRMALANPGSIKFASSHPTTVERYVRLEQTATEINEKRAAGIALKPETKGSPTAQRPVLARAVGPGPETRTALSAGSSVPTTGRVQPVERNVVAPSIPPSAPRAEPSKAPTFVGSKADRVYFLSECTAAAELSQPNRQLFTNESAAKAAGYRPSGVPGCALSPDTSRRVPSASPGVAFVGSRVDQVFYLRDCPAALDLSDINRRNFPEEQDALRAGYRRSRIQGC